jgi:hypothetical protein
MTSDWWIQNAGVKPVLLQGQQRYFKRRRVLPSIEPSPGFSE